MHQKEGVSNFLHLQSVYPFDEREGETKKKILVKKRGKSHLKNILRFVITGTICKL